ncbi:hypothetical protein V502_01024 [Pseudogymnoascus sp. VKM F-4520 (FW-2644)]|nr:hypothetical protein V502_01024 [Pseudogymnoascus sp. VKM F-4520 (FW-2644)]
MSVSLRSIFPPKPVLTEDNLPDQTGKTFIVTGSSSGIGAELATILYQHNAKVYIAARSGSKARATIAAIKEQNPSSNGDLVFLHLDLNDLTTIKKSADEFLAKEHRLDILWNNAGVMVPPQGSTTAQGYELQIGTNNLAPFLFTHFLHPLLKETAKTASPNSVRVIWVSSSAAEAAPKPAIDFSNMDYHREEGIWTKYMRSKAGNVLHGAEFARRTKGEGIISLVWRLQLSGLSMPRDADQSEESQSWQPEDRSSAHDAMPSESGLRSYTLLWYPELCAKLVQNLITYPPINGAYTELFAGLDKSITQRNNGGWVAPFGRVQPLREDLLEPKLGGEYWEWTERQVIPYM